MFASRRFNTVLLYLTCGMAACTSEPVGAPVIIDGSSTVHPISEAAAAEFLKKHPRQEIKVGSSSTGAGLKRFCSGELDIADASRHINASEVTACGAAKVEFVELPVAYDAISIIVNKNNTWATSITVAELKRLWAPAASRCGSESQSWYSLACRSGSWERCLERLSAMTYRSSAV